MILNLQQTIQGIFQLTMQGMNCPIKRELIYPSDKGGHDSADEDDNDPTDKDKNSKVDYEQRHNVTGNGEQPHNKLRYISKYLVQFVPDAKPQTSEEFQELGS